jgi:endoribonuclease LACTB2
VVPSKKVNEPQILQDVGVGVQRVALRTPTLLPATHTNCYLIGFKRFYVIEPASPWTDEQQSLHAMVRAHIARGNTLVGAIVTHVRFVKRLMFR